MKKVFMLLIASAALTMTACGGKKDEKKSEATSEAATTPEATADAAPVATSEEPTATAE
jgi:hypothetical protein